MVVLARVCPTALRARRPPANATGRRRAYSRLTPHIYARRKSLKFGRFPRFAEIVYNLLANCWQIVYNAVFYTGALWKIWES